ncbi:MAG: cobalamin biosynthesis protein [Prevotella sp.]|nr:cobalamin biosynthesis protein [Prevotella sp.]
MDSLLIGWVLDLLLGDPARLPHPIVWFGKMIAFGGHLLNKGSYRKLKGALMAIFLIAFVFAMTWLLRYSLASYLSLLTTIFDAIIIFYCLAGTTLIREVRAVFLALDRSLTNYTFCVIHLKGIIF